MSSLLTVIIGFVGGVAIIAGATYLAFRPYLAVKPPKAWMPSSTAETDGETVMCARAASQGLSRWDPS